MSTFQDVLNNVALVAGGTKQPAPPLGFYSGDQQGDGTGISGLKGCYSQAPSAFDCAPPVGIVLPRSFTATLMSQGYEENRDLIDLYLFAARVDQATDLGILTPFRDSVPAAFRAHMQLDQIAGATALTPEPLYAFVTAGRMSRLVWGGRDWYGWTFELSILRTPQVTYSS